MNNNVKVREERTGWRDEKLSNRHRIWGLNCPSVDMDFLMIEFNHGLPVAMVEYKHCNAKKPDFKHATYRALADLANNYKSDKWEGLPFIICVYWPESWSFKVYPVNEIAKKIYKEGTELSERKFVESLYYMRGLTAEKAMLEKLNSLTDFESLEEG